MENIQHSKYIMASDLVRIILYSFLRMAKIGVKTAKKESVTCYKQINFNKTYLDIIKIENFE